MNKITISEVPQYYTINEPDRLADFIKGELTKTSETNKHIYLSNGERYNKKSSKR